MILSRAMKIVWNVLIKYGNYLTKHSRLPLNPHRLLFVGLIQNSSIMRSVPVPLSGYSYLSCTCFKALRWICFDTWLRTLRTRFRLRGEWSVQLRDGESRRAIGHSPRPHVVECSSACDPQASLRHRKPDHVQIVCSTMPWFCSSLKRQQWMLLCQF